MISALVNEEMIVDSSSNLWAERTKETASCSSLMAEEDEEDEEVFFIFFDEADVEEDEEAFITEQTRKILRVRDTTT